MFSEVQSVGYSIYNILQRYEKYDFYGLLWFKKRNIVIYSEFEKTVKLIVEKCVKKY